MCLITRNVCTDTQHVRLGVIVGYPSETQLRYSDGTIRAMTSQITSVSIVYSTVCSSAYQRKHQSHCPLWGNSPVHSPHKGTLENRYGFWPQTGCVTVPGCEAAFLVARQRFPYHSRFNFSVKNMENMLPCNAICDIMHIDFSRKIYCGANDASIGF